MCEHFVIFK